MVLPPGVQNQGDEGGVGRAGRCSGSARQFFVALRLPSFCFAGEDGAHIGRGGERAAVAEAGDGAIHEGGGGGVGEGGGARGRGVQGAAGGRRRLAVRGRVAAR